MSSVGLPVDSAQDARAAAAWLCVLQTRRERDFLSVR